MNAQAFMRTSSKIRPCDTAGAPLLPAHRRSPAAYLGRRLLRPLPDRLQSASGVLSDPPGTMDSGGARDARFAQNRRDAPYPLGAV